MKLLRTAGISLFAAFIFIFLYSGCSKPASETNKPSAQIEHPTRGPAHAVLSIEQFSDFYCTYCKRQESVLKKVEAAYPGKMRVTFRHLPILGAPGTGSFPVHEASMCAAEQGKFWEFHDFVYALNKNADLEEVVRKINLEPSKFNECFKANRYREFVLNDAAEAQKRGVSGTPAFFLRGELVSGLRSFDYFAEQIDPEFAAKAAAERKAAEEEFLKKVDQSDTDRPSAGPENALITITEYSDFHCPFCVQLTATLKKVMESYPQDVRRVWRHFPLPMHPSSPYAHLASECAHSQGQFWKFHEMIFSDPGAARSKADMLRIADVIKLDAAQFQSCYDDSATKNKIENDVLLGMYKKVGSTPTFFVNDEMFVGAKSFEALKAVVDRKLAELKE